MEPGSQEQSCSTAQRKSQAWDLDLKTASGKYINLLYLTVQASAQPRILPPTWAPFGPRTPSLEKKEWLPAR